MQRFVRTATIREEECEGAWVLQATPQSPTCRLNATSVAILHLFDEPRSLEAAVRIMQDAYPEHSQQEIARDTGEQVLKFVQSGLVRQDDGKSAADPSGRRQKTTARHRSKKQKKIKSFDKYKYYEKSVQSPDVDVLFLAKAYRELRDGREAATFCEDFCGTFRLSCAWVNLAKDKSAFAIDIDPEPLLYGAENNFLKLNPAQQQRLTILNKSVLDNDLPPADIIGAFNFSYFLFKDREDMRRYFANVRARLPEGGLFFVDIFGGSACHEPSIEETKHKKFRYVWEVENFDPISNESDLSIHFKLGKKKKKKKKKKVFVYSWRMWSIPEIRDIMRDAGFSKTHVYWEGTTKKGEGDGIFRRQEVGEACEAWIAYIVAE